MAEESWDWTLQEWLTDTGSCYAAAMAQKADGAMYAAAPTENDAGWADVYAEDHEQEILQMK